MGWAGLLKALLGLADGLLGLFRDRSLRQQGASLQAAQDAARITAETVDEINTATEARHAVERDLALHPGGVLTPDRFTRPD